MTARPSFVGIEHDLRRYAFGAGWKDPFTRCTYCHDPCRKGWTLCDRCHAFAHPLSPIAHAYHARQRKVEQAQATKALLRQIMRHLTAIERGAIPALSARMDAVEDAWYLQ